MSTTLSALRSRLLVEVNGADSRMPGHAVDIVRVDQALRNAYISLQSSLPGAVVHTAAAFNLTGGSETFSLPVASSEEYQGYVAIQLNQDDYRFLKRLHLDEMQAYRNMKLPTYQARPIYFALWEDNTQTVQGFVHPRPDKTYSCNLTKSLTATDFDTTSLSTSTIALSRIGTDALIYKAAAILVASMTPEDLTMRKLNPNVAKVWEREAQKLAYKEYDRRSNLLTVGRIQRWVQ